MVVWIFLYVFAASADEPVKAKTCVACHGELGISNNELWPNIAGQKAPYLEKQIKEFKNDKRADPLMTGIAKSLSDKEIRELAEFYSRLKGAP